MKKYFSVIALVSLLISCQKEFNSPEQANNEVTSKGLKDGRWVEYILGMDFLTGKLQLSNDTIDKKHIGYRLIEYDKGFPVGEVKDFRQSGAKGIYKISINEPARLDNFPQEKYLDTIIFSDKNSKTFFLYYKDSLYLEIRNYDTLSKKTLQKNISVYYKNIPSERQKLIDEIDLEFLKKYNSELWDFFKKPGISFNFKRSFDILYLDSGKIDTIKNNNSFTKNIDKSLLDLKNEISIAKSKIYGKLVKCNCCNNQFHEKKGWQFINGRAVENSSGYYSSDPEQMRKQDQLQHAVDKLSNFLRLLGAKEFYYCSMKCAAQCGPYE